MSIRSQALWLALLVVACSSVPKGEPLHPVDHDVAGKVRRGEISFSEDTGASFEQAIQVIGANDAKEGVLAEYAFLEKTLGATDWIRLRQALISHDNRMYDVITVRLADGSERAYYFDAGDYYGQQQP